MKKQIYTISASIICTTLIQAQVVLYQANHAPVPGDIKNMKEIDTTSNIRSILGISGNGVTWNFTGTMYSNGNTPTDYFVNPTSLPGTSTYTNAGANVALSDSGGFYRSSSTKLEYLGDMHASGEQMDFITNPGDIMRYPFSYGSSYTDIGIGNMNAPNLPPFNLNGTITVSGDGQGTLILPSNPNVVFNNVLKVYTYVKLIIQGTGSLSTVTGTQTIEMFDFYVSGQKFPVFEVEYQRVVIPAFGTNQFKFYGTHTGAITLGINSAQNANMFFIYPNPARQTLFVSGISNSKIKQFIIYNILGEKIQQIETNNSNTIDISELNNGVYILHIISDDFSISTIKFIKE